MQTSIKPTYTEAEIISGCIKGERKFQEILYHTYSSKIYRSLGVRGRLRDGSGGYLSITR